MRGWGVGFQNIPSQFVQEYFVISTGMAGKDVDSGDKIYLPPSALDRLARMNVEYPMLFEVTNMALGNKTHCGVLEFSSDEGFCYMPYWMMQNLGIQERSMITVKNVSLSKATFVKFRAQSVDFLEVSNPRALLEVALRKFTCLTVGDIIAIPHGRKQFFLEVREVQPNGAASIIETDCNVDFEEPLGYKDSKYAQYEKKEEAKPVEPVVRSLQKAKAVDDESDSKTKFVPFGGAPKRIDGKVPASVVQAKSSAPVEAKTESKITAAMESKPSSSASTATSSPITAPAVPAYESKIGDKYSKKKFAVAAFAGAGKKLS